MSSKANKLKDEVSAASRTVPPEERQLRRENRELKKIVQQLKGSSDFISDMVAKCFEGVVVEFIPPGPPKPYDPKAHTEIPVAIVSDTQIGKVTKTYNSKTARERLMLYAQKIALLTTIHRQSATITELHLYIIGDIVEGEVIFPTQPFLIDSSVMKQAVNTAPNILAEMIFFLLGHFEKIKIFTVPGNHGRSGTKGSATHPETNWDNVCYEVTRLMVNGPNMDPRKDAAGNLVSSRVEFNISTNFWNLDRIGRWGYFMIHGDQITGGFAGFPWYGVSRFASKMARNHEIPSWDYMFLGHFHTPANWTINDIEIFANGTTESSNDYALANMAAAGFPCQTLCFVSPKSGMLSSYKVYLDAAGRVAHADRVQQLSRRDLDVR